MKRLTLKKNPWSGIGNKQNTIMIIELPVVCKEQSTACHTSWHKSNPDSRKILQALSEQCEAYDLRVESKTGEYRKSSVEENNAYSKN